MEQKLTIKDWAQEDRPREKLEQRGAEYLSTAELLGILLSSGSREYSAVELSKILLRKYGNSLESLSQASIPQLISIKGIGKAKAITIMAAIEMARRLSIEKSFAKATLDTPQKSYSYAHALFADKKVEECWVVLLNSRFKVVATKRVSIGGLSSTTFDQRIILKEALAHDSSQLIVIHNHPSGQCYPSCQDMMVTLKLLQSAKLLDIHLADHLIYTRDGYFSFADNNLLSEQALT